VRCTDSDIEVIRSETARTLETLDTEGATRRLLDENGNFDRMLWEIVSDLGWLGISVPETLGGLGMGLAARCVIAEELGRHLGSVPFGVSTCAMSAIALAGSAEQQALLAEAIRGKRIFTIALFETGDAAIPRACATTFDGKMVTGEKVAVIAGGFAQAALVLCNAGDLVLIDLDQPSVHRMLIDTIDNSRGYARLNFDGATATALRGDGVLDAMLDELAVVSAFEQVGGADSCLAATRDYALQRHAFGQPIGAFQAVKHGLADFYVLIQIARGAALSALHASPKDLRLAAAGARLAAIRAYDHCAQEAIQLHGGIGTTWESAQHLHLRRSRCLAQEWGSAAFWRDRLLDHALELGDAA
jgi:alkylation response protein AidB-like acyl-CoA dehydrogenase